MQIDHRELPNPFPERHKDKDVSQFNPQHERFANMLTKCFLTWHLLYHTGLTQPSQKLFLSPFLKGHYRW